MTREETVQALFDAFNRRELDAMLPHLDKDVEMVPLRAEVEDIRYRGHAQMADFLDDVESTWAGMQIEVEEIRAEGDRCVVVGRMRGIGSVSGASTELPGRLGCRLPRRPRLLPQDVLRPRRGKRRGGGGELSVAALEFRVMGVVNVTPDSFSDGGRFLDADAAVDHALDLAAEGADILDFGGESTRPGSEGVSAEEEMRRVIPVIERVTAAALPVAISIDTSKTQVAEAAVAAGATLVNDVTALRGDPGLASFVAEKHLDCCLMHMLGEPRTMQVDPRYDDVVDDVKAFLAERVEFAVSQGIAEERLLVDPGIGFGKTVDHNLELVRRLDELVALGPPVVIGTSRKSFLGKITGRDEDDRLPGTIATNVLALERGARVFRVHDVRPVRDALEVAAGTVSGRWTGTTTPTTSSTRT